MKTFIYNTKNPLGNPTGLKIVAVGTIVIIVCIEVKLLPIVLPQILKGKGNIDVLLYPLMLDIIPFLYPMTKWINLNLIHYRKYRALQEVVQSAQLVDYDKNKFSIFNTPKVLAGVKVVCKQSNDNLEITIYPKGIKNSDKVNMLTDRLQEAFGMTVISVNKHLTHTTYSLGNISAKKKELHNDDF